MFIEVLLLRDIVLDSFFCHFEFEFCVLSHFQSRGLTSAYAVSLKIEKASHMLCLVRCISCDIVTLLEAL
jgi:hypothetical protein